MKLITYCKSCKKSTSIDRNGILLRSDLKDKHGDQIPYRCTTCLQHQKVHPNQVYAVHSKLALLITSVIGVAIIFGVLIIKNSFGFSSAWLIGIGGAILSAGFLSSNSSNAKAFNKYLV